MIEQTKRDPWEALKWAGLAFIMGGLGILLLFSSFEFTDTLSTFDIAFYRAIFVIFSCISAMEVYISLDSYREHVGNRIDIDIDRARLMRGERVLKEVDFHKNPRVESTYKRLKRIGSDPEVQGVYFGRGLKSVHIEAGYGLTQGLVDDILPLVSAASNKHDMRLGDNITELFGEQVVDREG